MCRKFPALFLLIYEVGLNKKFKRNVPSYCSTVKSWKKHCSAFPANFGSVKRSNSWISIFSVFEVSDLGFMFRNF